MLIFSLVPFVCYILSFLFWLALRLYHPVKFRANYLRNCITTCLVFTFMFAPSIMSYTFSMFNCIEIEGKSYLQKDTSIECWGKDHININIYFTLPIIMIWVIGYPLLIFCLLFKNRKKLDDKEVLMKYGFYYIGFKDEAFYWQILVIHIKRIVFTFIQVVLAKLP